MAPPVPSQPQASTRTRRQLPSMLNASTSLQSALPNAGQHADAASILQDSGLWRYASALVAHSLRCVAAVLARLTILDVDWVAFPRVESNQGSCQPWWPTPSSARLLECCLEPPFDCVACQRTAACSVWVVPVGRCCTGMPLLIAGRSVACRGFWCHAVPLRHPPALHFCSALRQGCGACSGYGALGGARGRSRGAALGSCRPAGGGGGAQVGPAAAAPGGPHGSASCQNVYVCAWFQL